MGDALSPRYPNPGLSIAVIFEHQPVGEPVLAGHVPLLQCARKSGTLAFGSIDCVTPPKNRCLKREWL